MSEIAVVLSRKTRLQQWADEGKAGAGVALELAGEATIAGGISGPIADPIL